MKKGLKEYTKDDWEYKGAELARSSDNEQAAFFKAFLAECNSWGTHFQVEKQFAWLNIKLTKEEREQLSMITFIED